MVSELPAAIRGAGYMVLAGISWTGMMVAVRLVSDDFHTFELLLFRNVIAVAVVLPMMLRGGAAVLRSDRLGLHAVRTVLAYLGMMGLYYGIAHIPLADVVALSFTQPLFITVMAAALLSEAVGVARWRATAVGFVGILIIVRPGFAEIGLATLAVLASAVIYAGSNICIKMLMRTDTATQSVAYVNLMMLPLSIVPALLVWTAPSWADAPAIVGIGLGGALGVYFVSRAYATADASAVVPYDFLRLPLTAAIGYVLFSEVADVWTWAGAAVIFGSSYMLVRLETRAERAGAG